MISHEEITAFLRHRQSLNSVDEDDPTYLPHIQLLEQAAVDRVMLAFGEDAVVAADARTRYKVLQLIAVWWENRIPLDQISSAENGVMGINPTQV